MVVFFHILGHNIVPIFVLITSGFILSRHFSIDISSLSKLLFYLFVPAFIFVNLYITNITIDMVKVFVCGVLILIANNIIGEIISRIRKSDECLKNAFKNSIMFNNCGNIGVSLVTLIFTSDPFVIDGKTPYLDVAIIPFIAILILQNLTANTVGFYYAGKAKHKAKESFIQILSMPSIYVLPIVLTLKLINFDLASTVVWPALEYLKDGLVPMALLTLGIQLSNTKFNFRNVDVHISVFTKLIIGPVIALVFVYLFGFSGIIAQTLLIAYAVPTAVNMALIAVECDNCPDFSAQAVMLSTVFSALTLTFVIYEARIIFPV